jgi:hypothetical protein
VFRVIILPYPQSCAKGKAGFALSLRNYPCVPPCSTAARVADDPLGIEHQAEARVGGIRIDIAPAAKCDKAQIVAAAKQFDDIEPGGLVRQLADERTHLVGAALGRSRISLRCRET